MDIKLPSKLYLLQTQVHIYVTNLHMPNIHECWSKSGANPWTNSGITQMLLTHLLHNTTEDGHTSCDVTTYDANFARKSHNENINTSEKSFRSIAGKQLKFIIYYHYYWHAIAYI